MISGSEEGRNFQVVSPGADGEGEIIGIQRDDLLVTLDGPGGVVVRDGDVGGAPVGTGGGGEYGATNEEEKTRNA